MPLSRRLFLNAFGLGANRRGLSATFVSARGREANEANSGPGPLGQPLPAASTDSADIRIDSNENPTGPGAAVMAALVGAFGGAGRYPTNSRPSTSDLRNAVARKLSVRPENVVMGAGSRELLRSAVRIFTSPTRHLITAAPSYEQPERMAGLRIGYAIGQVRTIEAMARWAMPYSQSTLGVAAAIAALADQAHIDAEQARNTEVRRFTTRFFKDAGLQAWDSQANFVFVEI